MNIFFKSTKTNKKSATFAGVTVLGVSIICPWTALEVAQSFYTHAIHL